MDYKSVLQEQVRELQKLQDQNMKASTNLPSKIEYAVIIADQIRKIYVDVRGPLD